MKNLAKVAGILSIVFGVLLLMSLFGILLGAINIVLGIILVSYSNLTDDKMATKRGGILAISIISMFTFNWITGILGFILHDKLSDYQKTIVINNPVPLVIEPPIDPEIKRLNILTQLGAFLIILSGIIFATSSWKNLTGEIKVGMLLVISGIFYALSIFMDKRLKLTKSSMVYYSLSLILTSFAYLCAGYFKLFGEYFSLFGDGINLFIASVGVLITILLYIPFRKYQHSAFLIAMYSVIVLTLIYLLRHFEIEYKVITLIIAFLSLVIGFIKSNGIRPLDLLHKFNSGLLIIIGVNAFGVLAYGIYDGTINIISADSFIYLLTMLFVTINGYFMAIMKDDEIHQALAPIYLAISSTLILGLYDFTVITNSLIILTITLLIYASGFYLKELPILSVTSFVVSCIWQLGVYTFSFGDYDKYKYLPFIIAIALLLNNLYITYRDRNYMKNLEIYSQPIKIMFVVFATYHLLKDYITFIELKDCLIIAGLLFALIYWLQKEMQMKWVYYLVAIIGSGLYYLIAASNGHWLFNILNLVVFILLFIIGYVSEEGRYQKLSMPLFLVSCLTMFTVIDALILEKTLEQVLLISTAVIYIIIATYFRRLEKPTYSNSALLFLIIPYITFLNTLYTSSEPTYIKLLVFVGLSAFVLGFTRLILAEISNKAKNVLEVIFILLFSLSTIFIQESIVGVSFGVIGILFILLGSYYKKMNSLFITGIVFTIANAIIQLWELWSNINFGIYLFFAGVTLISVVTYRELQHTKNFDQAPTILVPEVETTAVVSKDSVFLKFLLLFIMLILFGRYSVEKSFAEKRVVEKEARITAQENYVNKVNANEVIIDGDKVILMLSNGDYAPYLDKVYVEEGYTFDRAIFKSRVFTIQPNNYSYEVVVLTKSAFNRLFDNSNYYYYPQDKDVISSDYYYETDKQDDSSDADEEEFLNNNAYYIYTYYGLWELERDKYTYKTTNITSSNNDKHIDFEYSGQNTATFILRLDTIYDYSFNINCYSKDLNSQITNVPLKSVGSGTYTVTFTNPETNYCELTSK